MCIDARMNQVADRMNDGKTVFVRTAAGNPPGVSTTLETLISKYPITQITYIPHTDCGACKFTHSLLKNKGNSTQEIEHNLVSTMRSYAKGNYSNICGSPEDLELKLKELGTEFILKKFPALKLETRLEDTSTPVTGQKTLVLLRPSERKYSEICNSLNIPEGSTYISQHYNLSEAICDAQLSISALHITKLIVGITENEERSKIEDEVAILGDSIRPITMGTDVNILIEELQTAQERTRLY